MFIVIIDEFSKWPEVIPMTSTTSLNTINVMMEYFTRYGICKTFVTDNGPQWTSNEFKEFIKKNYIKHILTPPYHPQNNVAAKNMVGIFKDKMKKILHNTSNIIQAFYKFLLDYRNTTHCTTGKSPAEMHMNRKLNNIFDLV